jgi:cystathionine beta-lyase
VRLKQHQQNALEVVQWLQQRPEVAHIRHPALAENPGHAEFVRDFSGSNGLFSFVLHQGDANSVAAFIEGMQHFKMGFSWGGYESLIIANLNVQALRTATVWPYQGPLIRLHIGLEDPADLIADLALAFSRFNQALAAQ